MQVSVAIAGQYSPAMGGQLMSNSPPTPDFSMEAGPRHRLRNALNRCKTMIGCSEQLKNSSKTP
jgi:hypothetical protein